MREGLRDYWGLFLAVAIVIMTVALVLYAVFVTLPQQAQSNRYAICMATERFSAAECRYIAEDLYMEMWGVELR